MKPIVLIPSGDADADFIYATGLAVETSLYIRFGDGDDVLVTSPLEVEVDAGLFQAERRRKSSAEAGFIEDSQRAAEAAVVEVVSQLAQADIRDGILWLDEKPLTSERLYARASLLLGERGFVCPDMIIT